MKHQIKGECMIDLDGKNLLLRHKDHGRLTLTQWKVEPLGADALKNFFKGENIDVRFSHVVVEEDPTITSLNVRATFPTFGGAAAIVEGGWLPPTLAIPHSVVLADRNFITNIVGYYENGKLKRPPTLTSNFFDVGGVPFSIDVTPYPIESNIKEEPTQALVRSQIDEVIAKVHKALPSVQVAPLPGGSHVDFVMMYLGHVRSTVLARQEFLLKFCQTSGSKVGKSAVTAEWEKIFGVAKSVGLAKNDLCVLVTMLLVTCKPKDWPGVRIVKPSANYSLSDAYSAAMDIAMIELLLNLRRFFPHLGYSFMTGDLHLLKLSALLRELTHASSDGQCSTSSASIPIGVFDGDIELALAFKDTFSQQ